MKKSKPKPRSPVRRAAHRRAGSGPHRDKRRSKKTEQKEIEALKKAPSLFEPFIQWPIRLDGEDNE